MPINWDFDSKEYNPDGQFSPLPPGDYRVRIEEAEETEEADETVKTGDDMTAGMYIWLFVLSAALTGMVTTVSRQAHVRKK